MELQQVDSALAPGRGRGRISEARIQGLVDEMRVLYVALPKNAEGKLGPAATRYALNRVFRRTRAWLVRGIAPDGLSWNASYPTNALHGESPVSVESLFEQHFNNADRSGLNLEEVALLAATVEEQIFVEVNERLKKAYHAMGLPITSGSTVTWEQAEEALDLTLMSYHAGMMSHPTVFESKAKRDKINKVFPTWPASQEFHRVVLRDEVPRSKSSVEFATVEHVARAIVERFGPWQQGECTLLKQALVAREGACFGHVPLVDFYNSALADGKWQFSESTDYLRALGALDESDPARPNVIVPNYIDCPSNLVGESRVHSVVCQDECEPIMARLEAGLRWPSATPEEIITIMEDLLAPRNLSDELIRRLDDVAQPHEGRVLIHGRLFAQWLHHVKPRECGYPQRSGTTTPVNPSQYWGHTVESKLDMQRDMEQLKKARAHGKEGQCPAWAAEEELVDPLAPMELAAATPAVEPEATSPLVLGAIVAGCTFSLIVAATAVFRAFRVFGRGGGPKVRSDQAPQKANLINM
jgi:hypothetical protein